MFRDTTFNNGGSPSINNWNTANVTTLEQLFYLDQDFNQPVGSWNTVKVWNMANTFGADKAFNQPIGNWNTANVTTMNSMFAASNSATMGSFNQDISNWNVSKVGNFWGFMWGQKSFNNAGSPGINNWILKTTGTVNMTSMFTNAYVFNQPIGNWNTSAVTSMNGMFAYAGKFNQPIGNWNTANITNMNGMFSNATSFDQDISGWNFGKLVKDPTGTFEWSGGAFGFLTSSGLSVGNYDKLLKSLYDQPTTVNLNFGAGYVKYSCEGKQWRDLAFYPATGHTNPIYYADRYSDSYTGIPAPKITSLTPGDQSIDLTFTTPSCYAGTVTDVQYSTTNGANWITVGSAASSIHIAGLTNGQSYPIRVKVKDSIGGWGPMSTVSSGTPFGPPRTTLYVVPDAKSIRQGLSAPGAGFYTYSLLLNPSDPNSKVSPTLTKAPSCGSNYLVSTPVSTITNGITCGGAPNGNSGDYGDDPLYSFDYSAKANLTVTPKPTLYVVPNALDIPAGSSVPSASFYTFKYFLDAGLTQEVTPTLTTAPTCGSAFDGTELSGASRTISCGGPAGGRKGTYGSDSGYLFNYSGTATLSVKPNTPVTLYVVPSSRSIAYGTAAPSASFYTIKYYKDAAHTILATPTLTTAPTCSSSYSNGSTPTTTFTISCGGGTLGTPGSSAGYLFDYSATDTLTVVKADVTVSVTCSIVSVTYDGVVHTPCSVTVTGPAGLSLTPAVTYTGDTTNAGTVTASYTYAGDSNYNSVATVTQNFEIAKAPTVSSITCPTSVVYNGNAQNICTVSVVGAVLDLENESATYTPNTNVGTVTANYHFGGDANHLSSDADSVNFDITKAETQINLTCPDSVVYDGTDKKLCSADVSGDGGLSLTAQSPTYTGDTVNAGSVAASYTYDGDSNHNSATVSQTYQISKVTTSIAYTGDTSASSLTGPVTIHLNASNTGFSGCTGDVQYVITPNPVTGSDSVTVNTTVSALAVNYELPSQPAASTFKIEVKYLGNSNCAAANDTSGLFTLATPGDSSVGKGSYVYSTRGAVASFDYYATHKKGVLDGRLSWEQFRTWRWYGEVTSYNIINIGGIRTGVFNGVADLFVWNPRIKKYVVAKRGVSVTFYSQIVILPHPKQTKYYVAVSIDYVPKAGEPALPPSIVSGPNLLKGTIDYIN